MEAEPDDAVATTSKVSPMMTVHRESKELRVYKRTYLGEVQQLDAGKVLPASRLARIVAAAQQIKQEVERAARRSAVEAPEASQGADAAVPDDEDHDAPEPMLRLGSVVALAMCRIDGVYEWWAGRVGKMQVKSAKGRMVDAKEPMPLAEARTSSAKVICTWYSKHARYVFKYDGPVDDQPYSMDHSLGLLDFELPDSRGRYCLRDLSQGPQLDAALELTKPAHGKKRTRGEEQVAHEAQQEREYANPKDTHAPTVAVPRAPGKRRATAVRS
jgi:hypothetical protein